MWKTCFLRGATRILSSQVNVVIWVKLLENFVVVKDEFCLRKSFQGFSESFQQVFVERVLMKKTKAFVISSNYPLISLINSLISISAAGEVLIFFFTVSMEEIMVA